MDKKEDLRKTAMRRASFGCLKFIHDFVGLMGPIGTVVGTGINIYFINPIDLFSMIFLEECKLRDFAIKCIGAKLLASRQQTDSK